MAGIGLSKPYYAVYNYDETTGKVTYSGGGIVAKAIDYDVSLADASENTLNADNGPAETDNKFAGGTVTLGVDRLKADVASKILGLKIEEIETPIKGKRIVYDDDQNTPYVGIGVVQKLQEDGAIKYAAAILTKVKFKNPGATMSTQGDTIEWQTPSLEGKIMRSDEGKHKWKEYLEDIETEADAETYIKNFLNINVSAEDQAGA